MAEEGSFDHEYGMKWKALIAEHKQKEQELKAELQLELDNLYKKMEIERYEYETEKLRERKLHAVDEFKFSDRYKSKHRSVKVIKYI